MKSYKLIQQLISLVEDFENTGIMIGYRHYRILPAFLVNHLEQNPDESLQVDVRFGKKALLAQHGAYELNNSISRLFIYMSRYAKLYIKKALDNTPLQTAEDFTYLAILLTHDDLSKSELISKNLQEKTSGTEVIRRLIAAGLVEQWDHETDKRGKRIAITKEGKELLYNVFIDIHDVSTYNNRKTINHRETYPVPLACKNWKTFHYDGYQHKSVLQKADLKKLAEELTSN